MLALTSLSPSHSSGAQPVAIASWRAADLSVVSFNHPSEIEILARAYADVTFVPIEKTSIQEFGVGRHYVPIKAMLDWTASRDGCSLIINADIELSLSPATLRRLGRMAASGPCYFRRHNHDGDRSRAVIDPHGIDAFLLHAHHARDSPASFLSMGQAWWDYWLPIMLSSRGLSLRAVEFPVAFHRSHAQHWSWDNWHKAALEFDRLTQRLGADRSLDACRKLSFDVWNEINRRKRAVSPRDIEAVALDE